MSNAQVTSVFTARDSMTRTLKGIESSTTRLDKAFGSLRGRIRSAFEFNVVNRATDLLARGIHNVVDAIPDLIRRGEQWAHTVDSISDITGMAAGQASELAAVAENVGVSADGLGRMMNALARSVGTNADQLREYGIRVKDANGHQLDAYTIFQNVRQRIAQMGPSLQAAKLGQLAFGRAALESADLLTLSNTQWERQVKLARESGLIMTQAGMAAAEEWERTQGRLQQAITGIGAQILQGVAPALTGLTNGITKVVNANMNAIVSFASGLVNFLATLAADLMGVQIDTTSMIGNAYDAAAKRADRLRKRIDDMTNSNHASTASHQGNAAAIANSRKEQERLEATLAKARRSLAAERSATSFSGDKNAVEIELARQRKAQAIKDAQGRVSDAQKAIADHRDAMAKMGANTAAATGHMRLNLQKTFGGGGAKGVIIEGLDQTLKDSHKFALQISDAIKDAVFGDDQQIQLGGGAPIEVRSGGLLDKLGSLGTALGTVGAFLNTLNGLMGGNGPLVLGLLALAKVLPLGAVGGAGGGLLSTAAGAVAGAAGVSVPTLIVGAAAAAALAALPAFWTMAGGGPPATRVAGSPGTHISSDRPASPDQLRARSSARPDLQALLRYYNDKYGVGEATPMPDEPPASGPQPGPAPGLGFLGTGRFQLERVFRTWLGDGSPTVQTQQDQLGSLAALFGVGQATADQTRPLGDGTLGVQNPSFSDIGLIDRVRATVPIDNANGTYLGIWPTGGKKLPVDTGPGGSDGIVRDQLTAIKSVAKWTQQTSSRLGSGGDIVYWLKLINTNVKATGGPATSSTRANP